jgi:hypothetical protein
MSWRRLELPCSAESRSYARWRKSYRGTLRSLLPYRRPNFFFRLLHTLSSQHFSAIASFQARRIICCAPPHSPDAPQRRPFTPFNLHRARIRRRAASFKSLYRKRANTPSSCRRIALCASDTTLGLPGTNPANFLERRFGAMGWVRRFFDVATSRQLACKLRIDTLYVDRYYSYRASIGDTTWTRNQQPEDKPPSQRNATGFWYRARPVKTLGTVLVQSVRAPI